MAFQRGTQIQPRLGAVDFSPVQRGAEVAGRQIMQGVQARAQAQTNAAAIQAQAFSNLGQQIGSAVQKIGQKQEEKKRKESLDNLYSNIGKTLMGDSQMGGPNQAGMNADMSPVQQFGRKLYTDSSFRKDMINSEVEPQQLLAYAQMAEQMQAPSGPTVQDILSQTPSGMEAEIEVGPEGAVSGTYSARERTQGRIVSQDEFNAYREQGFNVKGTPLDDGRILMESMATYSPTPGVSVNVNPAQQGEIQRIQNRFGEGFVPPGPNAAENVIAENPDEQAFVVEADNALGYEIRPMPGTEGAREMAAEESEEAIEAQKRTGAAEETAMRADTVLNAINSIDAVVSDPNTDLNLATGFMGGLTQVVPGTPAFDLRLNLQVIQSNEAFSALQTMRENSPTGGALGQVSNQEINLLQSTTAALNPGMSKEAFRESLQTLREKYQDVAMKAMHYPNAAEQGFGDPSGFDFYGITEEVKQRSEDNPFVIQHEGKTIEVPKSEVQQEMEYIRNNYFSNDPQVKQQVRDSMRQIELVLGK